MDATRHIDLLTAIVDPTDPRNVFEWRVFTTGFGATKASTQKAEGSRLSQQNRVGLHGYVVLCAGCERDRVMIIVIFVRDQKFAHWLIGDPHSTNVMRNGYYLAVIQFDANSINVTTRNRCSIIA